MTLRKLYLLGAGFCAATFLGCTTPPKTETIPHELQKNKPAARAQDSPENEPGAPPAPPAVTDELTAKFMKAMSGEGLTTDAAKQGEAAKLTAAWKNKVVFAPDTMRGGEPMPSLIVRLWLFGPDESFPVGPDGELVIALWDTSPKATGGAPVLDELWHIDRETAKRFRKADAIGDGFTLILPWSNYKVDKKQVNVMVRYNGADGRNLASPPETLTIDHSATLQKAQERLGAGKPQEIWDESKKPITRPWPESGSGLIAPK